MSDLSPDAKNLWEHAKKGGLEPSDAEIERVRQAVLQRIAAPAPGGPSVGSIPKWAKVAGVVVGLGAIVATGAKLVTRSVSPSAVVAHAPPPVAPAPEVPAPAEGEALPPEPASGPDKPSKEPGRAAPSARSSSVDTQSDTLAEQVRVITEARNLLRQGAFAQALAKASEYNARYPKGVFVEEDLAIRALSLCGLGRDKEAARARDTLERTAPNSRQLERLRSSCVGAKSAP
jgi:hypothetical protein